MKNQSKQRMVYVVTSGEYSDYRIEKIFTNAKRAEGYAVLLSGACYGEARVEPCPLNKSNILFNPKIKCFEVGFTPAGEFVNARLKGLRKRDLNEIREQSSPWKGAQYYIDVLAREENHAAKIAKDKLMQFFAQKKEAEK